MEDIKKQVEGVLSQLRTALQADGGDIELVEVSDKGVVKVRLKGACAGCPMSQMTMANFVEERLKKAIPSIKKVEAV
jgi:Fe-S cluster biogenesis protein NfuA